MNSPRELTPTFVLHRRSYSDNSLLLDCFTLRYGRLSCIAKGAKSGKSPRAVLLQPFVALVAGFSGRGEVKTLTSCEAVQSAHQLQDDRLYSAFYLNELLQQFLKRDEPHEMVFAHYAESLSALSANGSVEDILRRFECVLLRELGYGLELMQEAGNGNPVVAEQIYQYQPEHGPVVKQASAMLNEVFPQVAGETLLALQSGEFSSPRQVREAKLLMRFLIGRLLGGYNFKSREFFQAGARSKQHEQSV